MNVFRRRRIPGEERGQSLVEFAMILPFLMLLIMGAIEFGFVFNHHLTLEYASREGARVGAALVNGGGDLGCGAGQSPNWTDVDKRIVAAVERVLTSNGSPIDTNKVHEIRIYKADASGKQIGSYANVWTYTPGAGPTIDGTTLDFSPPPTDSWKACSRNNLQPADSLGVRVTYTYQFRTPFLALVGFSSIDFSDRTVMALNPTNQ
jgi:TadE-like protein